MTLKKLWLWVMTNGKTYIGGLFRDCFDEFWDRFEFIDYAEADYFKTLNAVPSELTVIKVYPSKEIEASVCLPLMFGIL